MHHFDRMMQAVQEIGFDLSQLIDPPKLPPQVRVLKEHPGLHKPALNLADYVDPAATPPSAVHRSHLGNRLLADPLLNTELGDCGEAMAIHAVEAFHLDAGTPVPPFGPSDALRLYEQVGGYVPGDPSTDNGTDNSVLVDHWRNPGITCAADGSVHKIVHSLFVDPKDERVSKIAVWEFVVLLRAIGLPDTAKGQTHWRVTDPSLQGDAAVGSWGYHDIPYFSYDAFRLRNDSWGVPMLVDWGFDTGYGVGGIVVTTPEQLNLQGVSPAGVDWTRLNADLMKL